MTDKYQDLREATSNAEHSDGAYWLDRYRGESGPETIRGLLAERDALQAECERLRSIISDLKDWDCDVSAGFLSIPLDLRRRMQDAIDAAMAQHGGQQND